MSGQQNYSSDVFERIAQDIFDLESALRILMEVSQNQIDKAIKKQSLPEGAGKIVVEIHKSEDYRILIKNNGTGFDSGQIRQHARTIGRSHELGDDMGIWTIAPFLFSDEYMIKSNPRDSEETIVSHVNQGGFNMIDEEICDFDFIGMLINIAIDSDEQDVVELGKKIRKNAKENTHSHVIYEMYDGGDLVEDMHFNVD